MGRIQLIDFKENKGLRIGRNTDIRKSKGDYLLFLESNDWLNVNAIQKTYDKIIASLSNIIVFRDDA